MSHDEINARLRRAAGRQSPEELVEAAIATAKRVGDAVTLRERLAVEAGLPPAMGARLQGQDAGELKADAEALAETLAEIQPSPPETFNDRIRHLAGSRDSNSR